jgi:(p)ppGpp synthase/HD superfamily hydrolase
MQTDRVKLSDRFSDALAYAANLHREQVRKANGTPYIAHLLAVTSLVLEAGGDEDQAIAALLHDAVEDQGGKQRLEEIHILYGKRVARIVEGCTDSFETPKLDWRLRKESYLKHLPDAGDDVLLVSLADKLHNARSIVRDLRGQGDDVWSKFKGGRNGTLWYYRSLADIYARLSKSSQVDELLRTVEMMEQLADGEA